MKTDSHYTVNACPNRTSLFKLFKSVNWDKGTNAKQLYIAMSRSTHIVTAWHEIQLVGLIRSMDDNVLSANIDYLLVHKDYQRQSIATNLINLMLKQLQNIQCISVSPNEKKNFHLYETCGFSIITDGGLLQLYN